MLSDAVASVLIDDGGEFAHGFTYSGHPVACAVANENIRILEEEKIVERVRESTGPYFQRRLRELEDHPLVGEVRGVGLIAGIELVEDKRTRKLFDTELNIGIKCRNISTRRGLVMRAIGDSMVLSPPLITTRSQIDDIIRIAFETLDETVSVLKS